MTIETKIDEVIEGAAKEAAQEAVQNTPPVVIEQAPPPQPVAEIAAAAQAVQATAESAAALANVNAAERVAEFERKLAACLIEVEALKASNQSLLSLSSKVDNLATDLAALIVTLSEQAETLSEGNNSEDLTPQAPNLLESAEDAPQTPKKPRVIALGSRRKK